MKAIIVTVLALAVLIGGAIFFMQDSPGSSETETPADSGESGLENQTQEETQEINETPAPAPTTQYNLEADDYGFYMNGADLSSLGASAGEQLQIMFNVRDERVYYAGLDFKGCGIDTGKINPGSSVTVSVNAESTCTITSYWPSSGVVKDTLQIIVG